MGIRDRPTAPRSPWQNGHVERLIGSLRRECLDHLVVFGERHLRHVLRSYAEYYNSARTHLSLAKDAPICEHSSDFDPRREFGYTPQGIMCALFAAGRESRKNSEWMRRAEAIPSLMDELHLKLPSALESTLDRPPAGKPHALDHHKRRSPSSGNEACWIALRCSIPCGRDSRSKKMLRRMGN
jgi:hypothetical protein